MFDKAPLEGVGLQSWQFLWEQARTYSEAIAYLGQRFPFTGDDARCVLCQQTLDEEGKQRLISFETFVKGELESLAKAAESKVVSLLETLPIIETHDNFSMRLAALGIDDLSTTQKLHQLRDSAQIRREELSAATPAGKASSAPDAAPVDDLRTSVTALETKAKAFDEDANDAGKMELRKKVRELEAHKWLSEQKSSVEDEIVRLKKLSLITAAQRITTTTGLSKKKSELAQILVSDAFIGRFNSELKALSADRIRVELVQSRTDKGHVFHRIRLKNVKLNVPSSEVLSEGERRVVSLAAFLADIEGVEASTPVVLDDPITSLDQDFEESVVARLVTLAKKRQIIVFTHRLSMLVLLEDAAKLELVSKVTEEEA